MKLPSSTVPAPPPRAPYFLRQFDTYDSFVNPNAKCPVCRATVFYYESPFGGRVFFDELGPPWPKHGCTSERDRGASTSSAPTAASSSKPLWEASGWEPLRIIRKYKEDDWWVVRATVLGAAERPLRLLFDEEPQLQAKMIALFNGWDPEGCGVVSYLEEEAQPAEVWTYSYSKYVLEPPHQVVLL